MTRYLGLLWRLLGLAVGPSPALDADAVVPDVFALRAPFGFPVDALAGAGVEPGEGDGPGVDFVLAACDAGGERGHGVEVLEEAAQCACWAGGLHADDAGCV